MKDKKCEFWNLPVEMYRAIFVHLDDRDLALVRGVCQHWKRIIESEYTLFLEMSNRNWEDFVTKTTALKLRVHADDLTYPIYQNPLYLDFAIRLSVLEFSGFIPMYNFVNILRGCQHLISLVILEMEMVNKKPSRQNYITWKGEGVLNLKKLNFCPPRWDVTLHTIITVTEVLGMLIQDNTMTELNLSSEFGPHIIVNGIYDGIFGADDVDLPTVIEKYGKMNEIIKSQSKSLRHLRFNHIYNTLPKKPKTYIKFHSVSNTNVYFSIRKSRLFGCAQDYNNDQNLRSLRRDLGLREMLILYKTQFKMENFTIMFENDADLQLIHDIITQNLKTLTKISIHSIEPIVGSCRVFDSRIFTSCSHLKNLTLKSDLNYRNNKVKYIELLPSSIKTLKLVGFIPTLSLEKLTHRSDDLEWRSSLQHLTKLTLDHLPWFFLDDLPVRVMELRHFRFLLRSLPKLEKLGLIALITDRFITMPMAQIIGLESYTQPVSLDFIEWCQNGGDRNHSVSMHRLNQPEKIIYTIRIDTNARKGRNPSASP